LYTNHFFADKINVMGIKKKKLKRVLIYISVLFIAYSAGCEEQTAVAPITPKSGIYASYAAEAINIMGLTEIVWNGDETTSPRLIAYIDMLDKFECRIKSPGIYRMELYEYVPRSAINTGTRIASWEDVNLNQIDQNNKYWQDDLRLYKFDLQLATLPQEGKTYILQATCITPSNKRLTDTFKIEYK
jgi:hypothetical protein